MQFISARLLHSAFTWLHARTAEKMAETHIISNLHPPPKKKEYFGCKKMSTGLSLRMDPVYKKCGRKVAAKAGNTSNMFAHIHGHHPSVQIKVSRIYNKL